MHALARKNRSIVRLISTLPSAADRVDSLTNMWQAVLVMDVKTRKARRGRGEVVPGASLQAILEDLFISSTLSGDNKAPANSLLKSQIQRYEDDRPYLPN